MKTFNISFTEQELNIIGQALNQAPYGVVAPIVASINKQIQEQLREAPVDGT